MAWPEPYPELDANERTTLTQFLDHYRDRIIFKASDLTWNEATARVLPASSFTVAGIVYHLAYIEDRWFHYRLGGNDMPTPWTSADTSVPDWSFNPPGDGPLDFVVGLYRAACARSREVEQRCGALDDRAPSPSFGKVPITLRWALVHMLEETACHAGHLDLLRDAIIAAR